MTIKRNLRSRIAAHPIRAEASLLAPVLATPTVAGVEHNVNAFAATACCPISASIPALPAVEVVLHHVHALLLAAVRAGASLGMANPGELIACHVYSGVRLGVEETSRSCNLR